MSYALLGLGTIPPSQSIPIAGGDALSKSPQPLVCGPGMVEGSVPSPSGSFLMRACVPGQYTSPAKVYSGGPPPPQAPSSVFDRVLWRAEFGNDTETVGDVVVQSVMVGLPLAGAYAGYKHCESHPMMGLVGGLFLGLLADIPALFGLSYAGISHLSLGK